MFVSVKDGRLLDLTPYKILLDVSVSQKKD